MNSEKLPGINKFVYIHSGNPASRNNFSKASATCGTFEACFTKTTFQAIKFGIVLLKTWLYG